MRNSTPVSNKAPLRPSGRLRAAASVMVVGVTVFALSLSNASAANRIFNLNVQNGLSEPVSLTVVQGQCWEGTPRAGVIGPIPAGGQYTMQIARIQGHGCDGKNGVFGLTPTTPRFAKDMQGFTFDNEGNLGTYNVPKLYSTKLSAKSRQDGSYTWTILPLGAQLPTPVDARLTNPRPAVAADAGTWGPKSRIQKLLFLNQPGLSGNFYDDCAGIELFHPQHIVRLANKNGRAYFMVAQSRAHNGWITVLETNPGFLDPATDTLVSKGDSVPVGKYIWQDLYRYKDQLPNPVGNWNHPGKMGLLGGVLVVAAQNWGESAPCFYGKGVSIDKVLFYDVRDPQHPAYWGAIDAKQLGVKEISTVGLVKTPAGKYLLSAGGDGTYTTLEAPKISPNFADWVKVQGPFSGQHGMMFSSYQKTTTLNGSRTPRGAERLMYFDSGERKRFTFFDWVASAGGGLVRTGGISYPMALPGANRDWDADSIYVSPQTGKTIVYTVKSARGQNGEIYQVDNPASSADNVGKPASFTDNLAGSQWSYGGWKFDFGATTVDNFSNGWWGGVTWKVSGTNQIQLRNPGVRNAMTMTFDSANTFTALDWDGKTKVSGHRIGLAKSSSRTR